MPRNILTSLTASQLRRATALKERIEKLERELAGMLGVAEPMNGRGVIRRRRRMSAEARARISAAAKARWARVRAGKGK